MLELCSRFGAGCKLLGKLAKRAGDQCATATVAARWHAVCASEQTAFGGGDILVTDPPTSVFALAQA